MSKTSFRIGSCFPKFLLFFLTVSAASVGHSAEEPVIVCQECATSQVAQAAAENYGHSLGLDCDHGGGAGPDPIIGPDPLDCTPPEDRTVYVIHPESETVYGFNLDWTDEVPWVLMVSQKTPSNAWIDKVQSNFAAVKGWQQDIKEAQDRLRVLLTTLNLGNTTAFSQTMRQPSTSRSRALLASIQEDEGSDCPDGTALHALTDEDFRSLLEQEIRTEIGWIVNDRGIIEFDGLTIGIKGAGVSFSVPPEFPTTNAFRAFFSVHELGDGAYEIPEGGQEDFIRFEFDVDMDGHVNLTVDYENSRIQGRENYFSTHSVSDSETCAIERLRDYRGRYLIEDGVSGARLEFSDGGYGWNATPQPIGGTSGGTPICQHRFYSGDHLVRVVNGPCDMFDDWGSGDD